MSVDHPADWSPDPEWVASQNRAVAVVSEGFCPNEHGELLAGAHGPLYGWCPECDMGWSACRLDDLGATVTNYFPDVVRDGIVVGPSVNDMAARERGWPLPDCLLPPDPLPW